ncbi:hypothetical protein EKK58_09125 [Candidatus Dependentiae bacterium]|nr:MAG: hypothetical protein EKK58_09125 [Candidatus Dependentiae bacterium]
MMTLAILWVAIIVGLLNAFRGSGFLKIHEYGDIRIHAIDSWQYDWYIRMESKHYRFLKILEQITDKVQWTLKRIIVPAIIVYAAWLASRGDYILAALAPLPYYFVIFTGTGGAMQAKYTNPCGDISGCVEFKPFDIPSDWFAARYNFWNYCQRWGFMLCLCYGVTFTLPFIATNYLYSLPMLLNPVLIRYANWRVVEFTWLGTYTFLYLGSIIW